MTQDTGRLADQIRSTAQRAGFGEDDDIGSMIEAMAKACDRLDAHMTTLEERPVAEVERAVRVALTGLRPAFEKRWRWQRWGALAVAFAAGCVVSGLTVGGTWATATSVTRQEARADSNQWSAWWNATCGDRSPNRVVLAGKPVCQVPLDRKAQ